MMMPTLPSFQDVLHQTEGGKRHLLLGNGFSIAWKKGVFAYDSLFAKADLSRLSKPARQIFAELKTSNFELVMGLLRDAGTVLKYYGPNAKAIGKRVRADADALKEILVGAIAGSHPETPGSVTVEEYERCGAFLRNFDGSVYTANYDLLLYWVLMHFKDTAQKIRCNDGFQKDEDEPEADFVSWDGGSGHKQNIFFLHGALHVFDAETKIEKFTWSNTGIRLIDQIRAALDSNKFPLFVSEGSSAEKRKAILHNGFLHKASRSFAEITGSLFTYGLSFADNDQHKSRMIERGHVTTLAVGIYGNSADEANRAIMNRVGAMQRRRPEVRRRSELIVLFYDAETAHVWR